MFKEQLENYYPKKKIISKSTNSKNFKIKIDETIYKDSPYYELSINQDFIEQGAKKEFFMVYRLYFSNTLNNDSISNSIEYPV